MSRFLACLLLVVGAGACSGILGLGDYPGAAPDAALPDGASDGGGEPNPDAVGATTASKVDLLLMVDNSASMGDKANLLADSIGTLIRRLGVTGDLHVGVIDSSLGAMGGDVCPLPAAPGHLRTNGPDGTEVATAKRGFLVYGPGGTADLEQVIADTGALVEGVQQNGCGFEAQLESAYRFLVQPDPWASITVAGDIASYVGRDDALLVQRRAFLRPDSLVMIVMLTDEDDSSVDPRSVGGLGWAFSNTTYPGSTTTRDDGKTTTAPRATSMCSTSPGSPACASCGCKETDAACARIKADPECQKNGGFYGAGEDSLNVRFQRMKQRFGVDPQFPLDRYVTGFTKLKVPDRDGEHVLRDGVPGDYLGTPSCTNPLFAASLPAAGEPTCTLPVGPRGKELVVFAILGGVPDKLLTKGPDWKAIVGADPDHYDVTGQDPHMLQSTRPRPGLAPPSAIPGDNGPDPVHGREWDTGDEDLQYACTFALQPPRAACSSADPACDCTFRKPPLCSSDSKQQTRAKAYPTLRELRLAQALGDRGVVGSICPTASRNYELTMNLIADRLARRIQ